STPIMQRAETLLFQSLYLYSARLPSSHTRPEDLTKTWHLRQSTEPAVAPYQALCPCAPSRSHGYGLPALSVLTPTHWESRPAHSDNLPGEFPPGESGACSY